MNEKMRRTKLLLALTAWMLFIGLALGTRGEKTAEASDRHTDSEHELVSANGGVATGASINKRASISN